MENLTEIFEDLKERWQDDSVFRDQIILACIAGVVTIGWTCLDMSIRIHSGVYR